MNGTSEGDIFREGVRYVRMCGTFLQGESTLNEKRSPVTLSVYEGAFRGLTSLFEVA